MCNYFIHYFLNNGVAAALCEVAHVDVVQVYMGQLCY